MTSRSEIHILKATQVGPKYFIKFPLVGRTQRAATSLTTLAPFPHSSLSSAGLCKFLSSLSVIGKRCNLTMFSWNGGNFH